VFQAGTRLVTMIREGPGRGGDGGGGRLALQSSTSDRLGRGCSESGACGRA
jgi:hypothetical protein